MDYINVVRKLNYARYILFINFKFLCVGSTANSACFYLTQVSKRILYLLCEWAREILLCLVNFCVVNWSIWVFAWNFVITTTLSAVKQSICWRRFLSTNLCLIHKLIICINAFRKIEKLSIIMQGMSVLAHSILWTDIHKCFEEEKRGNRICTKTADFSIKPALRNHRWAHAY